MVLLSRRAKITPQQAGLPDFRVANFIEDATKVFLLLLLAVFIWKGMGYNDKLMNYIVAGNSWRA